MIPLSKPFAPVSTTSLDVALAERDVPATTSRRWLSKTCFWAAWLGLSLAIVTPPHGSGITVCWFKASTGIPCPGCGLTRSMSCALHGMLAESLNYHPMGTSVLIILVVTAVISVLPSASKQSVCDFVEARGRLFNSIYVAFVVLFVGFGAIRSLVYLFRSLAA